MGESVLPPALPPPAYPPNAPIRLGVPWVVGVTAIEMSLFVVASVFLWIQQRRKKAGGLRVPCSVDAAGTVCGNARPQLFALLAFRVCNLIWFFAYFAIELGDEISRAGTSGGWLAATRSAFPAAYTNWCFYLQPFYWLLATTSSLMHLQSGDDAHGEAGRAHTALVKVGYYVRMVQWALLETVLPASWLVTLIVFTLLDPFQIHIVWNRIAHKHFWNAVALAVEFSINRLMIRGGHFVLMLMWVLGYMVYTWLMKATLWYRFVYWFMNLETGFALLWYPILALIHVLIYYVLVVFSRWKERRLDRGGCCCACVFPQGPGKSDLAGTDSDQRLPPNSQQVSGSQP